MATGVARGLQDGRRFTNAAGVQSVAVCVAAAGLLHLVAVREHWDTAGMVLYLVLSGAVEVVWALAFWRRPSTALYPLGIILTGGILVLWAVTRVFPPPFGHDHVEIAGVSSKVAEGAGLTGLLAMIFLAIRSGENRWSAGRMIAVPLTLAVMGGVATYQTGLAAERAFPWLADQDDLEFAVAEGQGDYRGLGVLEDGTIRPLENGGSVALADGVLAQITLTPYPAQRRTELRLSLVQEGGDREIGNIEVRAEGYYMTHMDDEIYTAPGVEVEPGSYLVPLDFVMRGDWAINLLLRRNGKAQVLSLITRVGL